VILNKYTRAPKEQCVVTVVLVEEKDTYPVLIHIEPSFTQCVSETALCSMTPALSLLLFLALSISVSGFSPVILNPALRCSSKAKILIMKDDVFPSTSRQQLVSTSQKFGNFGAALVGSALLSRVQVASAKDVSETSLAESKKAALTIKDALNKISEIEKAGTDYEKMGKILGEKCFTQFADNAYVLTRSAALTPEDKVALGTIKRYGVVADAIIMVGGLAEALRAGGIEVAGGGGGYSDQAPIIDDSGDDDVDEEELKVNPAEVKKYIKLSRGAFQDIDRITSAILSK
jgi:hypothetical protein